MFLMVRRFGITRLGIGLANSREKLRGKAPRKVEPKRVLASTSRDWVIGGTCRIKGFAYEHCARGLV